MDSIKSLYQEMSDWITYPFKKDIPVAHIILIVILFAIVAFMVHDTLRILKAWIDAAAEAAAEAVT